MKHLYQTLKKNYFSFAKRAAITVAIIALAFTSFSQNLQPNVPAKDTSRCLLSFNIVLKSGFKVVMNWTVSGEKRTSHFIIQRSTDGNDFNDAAVFFTNNDNNDIKQYYRYADNVSSMDSGFLYYRLKTVSLDGNSEYSKVETVRIEKKMEAGIADNDSNQASDIVTIKYPASKSKQ
jgi:hypothetical protein